MRYVVTRAIEQRLAVPKVVCNVAAELKAHLAAKKGDDDAKGGDGVV